MSEQIKITVLGNPTPQKRHRSTSRHGKTRQYDPSSGDKDNFAWLIREQAPPKLLTTALRVDAFFFFARPKSHYRTGQNSHLLKDSAPEWHTSKPDRDNCDKFVLDSLKNIFWSDDSLVCAGQIEKKYSEKPRTEIIITVL